uniref:ODAD1 central coiled coil region domain-containing protein n=1 Tax=Periophthalmus magnuspinnatus TaxID=409849 RepID=A0A3B4AGY2_9GOBI
MQRQYRIMERDTQAYKIQARKQIRKQQEIEKLFKEQEELQRNLRVCESRGRRQQDQQEAQEIRNLLDQIQLVDEGLDKQKDRQSQLKQEQISGLELKIEEARREEVSRGNNPKTEARQTRKAIRTLENKLDRASTRLSEQLTKNRELREDIQHLLIERDRFQQRKKKLTKELQEVRKKIGEAVDQSTAAYDAAEAQAKISLMKEKRITDLAMYNNKMEKLQRKISHDHKCNSFMTTKCKDRPSDGDQKQSDVKELRRMDSLGEESEETLKEVFESLQKITGEDNLEVMVAKFLQEERNFALFNFVNEQNKEIEALREQINQIEEEMEKFRVEGLLQEQNHSMLVQELDNQQKDILSQAEEYENKADNKRKTLDLVKTINNIFTILNFDQSMIEDILGSSGINDNNIMACLSLIEQKTDEMLSMRAYLQSKQDLEKDCNPKDLAKFLLGQNPVLLEEVDAAQSTINKSSKTSLQSSSRQHSLED